jgi:hypothetical protein
MLVLFMESVKLLTGKLVLQNFINGLKERQETMAEITKETIFQVEHDLIAHIDPWHTPDDQHSMLVAYADGVCGMTQMLIEKVEETASTTRQSFEWVDINKRLPEESDGDADGCILALNKIDRCAGRWFIDSILSSPNNFYCWAKIPKLPEGWLTHDNS